MTAGRGRLAVDWTASDVCRGIDSLQAPLVLRTSLIGQHKADIKMDILWRKFSSDADIVFANNFSYSLSRRIRDTASSSLN